jgi:hypothetical protein
MGFAVTEINPLGRVPNGQANTAVVAEARPRSSIWNLALLVWLLGGHLRPQRTAILRLFWAGGLSAVALLVAVSMFRGGADPIVVAWLIYTAALALILYQPRYGIYLLLFFGLVGDSVLMPWFPFTKNFSSEESIFFVHPDLIVSPLEVMLMVTILSWLARQFGARRVEFYSGPLFWPALIFLAFTCFGIVWGLGRGGDVTIGLFEARPLFYLPLLMVLVSNLLTRREHFSHLMWAIVLAIFIEALIGTHYVLFVLGGTLRNVESITEHAAAVHMNTVIVLAAAAWIYKTSAVKRILLPLMVPVVLLAFMATQRRAAFLALGIACLLLAYVLFKERPYAFWLIVPPLMLLGVVYIAAYWNAGGALGKPAQAIKSVIAPGQLHLRDQLSNVYRVLENINVRQTIRAAPLTGFGFGHPFLLVLPLPDISFFAYWQYLPHNSILWIWIKMGVGGFVAMLYLVGMAITTSVQTWWRMPRNELSAIALTATLYLIMHFLYAYVDISWDIQSMLYVGAMMGVANSLQRIVARPVPLPQKRWPWQRDARPAPRLRPL